jgi:dGTPase
LELKDLITSKRRQNTTLPGRVLAEELASDRSRILYSAPFRRLAKKAQVFSLESNAAVRNRVIHSLEVSDIGRWIAYEVTKHLISKGQLQAELQLPTIYAVENACFLHDIGNPPFGHFGEEAIRSWFRKNWKECYRKSLGSDSADLTRMSELIKDFEQFDGNPQGLRIILRLRRDRDKFSLNLTYTTILSLIKYVRSPTEPSSGDLTKKPGYFESEKEIVLKMKTELGLAKNARYVLAYIMEAADDIAYCISDIEDGIEKGVLTTEGFFKELASEWKNDEWNKDRENDVFPVGEIASLEDEKLRFFTFKTSYTRKSIARACDRFLENMDAFLEGTAAGLFPKGSAEDRAFECLKRVSRRKLFRSPEAENPELAGYQIVTGLLDKLRVLLECPRTQFDSLLAGRKDPSKIAGQGLDYHWRLFNKLPKKNLAAYQDLLQERELKDFPEWYHRAHLIVDYVSGMTDGFALEFYQLLDGIRLAQEW